MYGSDKKGSKDIFIFSMRVAQKDMEVQEEGVWRKKLLSP